jgi:hypothetical protein
MRTRIAAVFSMFLLLGTTPARADFKYSDTSTVTGGSLKTMMKTVGIFNKAVSQAMKPVTTTHYLKGDRLRTDDSDGKIQIIDLAGRRIIEIDPQKRTYGEITFDQMKQAMQNMQAQLQQKQAAAANPSNPQVNVNAKVNVTPGSTSRQIQGMTANEVKVQVDMEIQAVQNSGQAPAQPNGASSGTISTTVDSWVAPSVPGYQELSDFYQRMAKEINWVPPSNIHVDPRVSQSMAELQKNQAAFKGMPLLEYVTMTMVAQQDASANTPPASNPAPATNSAPSSSGPPTSVSSAVTKGLGNLFGKKKKDDAAAPDQSGQNAPPPSTPGSLIEMTVETTSISSDALDAALFEVPAGYALVQANPDQELNPGKP